METKIDWSSLPGELLQLIADKLSAVEDFMALTSVCRYFRSVVKKDLWRPCVNIQPPWLLITSSDNKRCALSMYKNKKTLSMDLPELQGRKAFGTPYGWIITLGLDLRLHLFNPLNRRRVALPPPNVGPVPPPNMGPVATEKYFRMMVSYKMVREFIDRAILIKRPLLGVDKFLVVASAETADGGLSIMRPQESTWETVKLDGHRIGVVLDMAYYKDQIYVVGVRGKILSFSNLDGPGPLVQVEYLPDGPWDAASGHFYLLESLGDILLVARERVSTDHRTLAFNVFKLNPQTKKWTVVDHLGNRALFVSSSQSISLSSPENFNCRSNCIYFTEDYVFQYYNREKERDMGVFDLERRTLQHFCGDTGPMTRFLERDWFIPTFS